MPSGIPTRDLLGGGADHGDDLRVADLRFRRQVERLHAKGPRVVGELLAELGAERGIQTIIDEKLSRYVAIDDAALGVTGGREFPPVPLREVK